MSLPKALRWTLPPLALLALAGWIASGQSSPRQHAAPPEQEGPAANFPVAAGPVREAAVAKFVAQKNAESSRDQESFVRAGWQMVDVPPPDQKLIKLDPSLLATREPELRQQIATNTPSEDQAANLGRIAREASEEQTRVAAIDALGRIKSDEAQ